MVIAFFVLAFDDVLAPCSSEGSSDEIFSHRNYMHLNRHVASDVGARRSSRRPSGGKQIQYGCEKGLALTHSFINLTEFQSDAPQGGDRPQQYRLEKKFPSH